MLSDTEVRIVSSEATYLLWADCGAVTDDTDRLADFIRTETGLYISAGAQFGGNGKRFVRINVACPRSVVRDGMERFKRGIKLFKDNFKGTN
jgi:cystathionine beta-lyase